MTYVKKLPDGLANKIAAGEVVERPASVVKELVENAIDAGATTIQVDVEEGGLSLIRVTDNGRGMDQEDAELAFERHATSKLSREKDLFQIETLGFRGEALPSIAAVSNVTMETGDGREAGVLIRYQGGKRIACTPSKSRQGTQVEVRDLFFNTPARLKYVRTMNTEVANVADVMNRQALAHPDVSFRLYHHGKQLLLTNGNGSLQPVLAAIYGRQTARDMLYIEAETDDYRVSGWIAKPETYRASRQYMSTFVNHRYIRHYPLTKAIEAGYHTLLPIGKHPIAALHVEMNVGLIDVNVHPSKLDVRVSKEEELLHLVEQAVRERLQQERLIPAGDQKRAKSAPASEQMNLAFTEPAPKPAAEPRREEPPTPSEPEPSPASHASAHEASFSDDAPAREPEAETVFEHTETWPEEQETPQHEPETPATESTGPELPELRPIGQFHGTYILAENEDALYMIDQHAAQERIFYEYFRVKIGDVDKDVQQLLVPILLEVTKEEEILINDRQSDFENIGIFLEPFGGQTFRVHAHPTWFPAGDEESVIRECIEEVKNNKRISVHELREEAAILMSCKAAIKANRYLTKDEIQALVDRLRTCESPYTCPHGRPIIIHFSDYDMEKMFKRIM